MQVLISEIEDLEVVITEEVEFSKDDKEKYYEKFKECVSNGIIKDGTRFEDRTWCIRQSGVEHSILFPNDIQYKKLSKKEFVWSIIVVATEIEKNEQLQLRLIPPLPSSAPSVNSAIAESALQ